MNVQAILDTIDEELQRLQAARNLIAGTQVTNDIIKPGKKSAKKRTLSAEARKRIADAQRARWAAQKKAQK